MSDGKVIFDITGNLSPIDSALNAATSTISKQTAKWTVLGQTAMNGLVSAVKTGMNGIRALWDNAFEYNAQMQTYEVNFKTLLGSAEAAQAKLTELKQYAVKTPFAFTDLAQATQTLLAFDVSSEDASLALKHLGDISLGDANKLQSLTLAFGQVSSAGKLAGQDLLQMINAGFNPLNVIAKETGAAYADLKAVMSGEKTSEDFQLRLEAARKEVEELGTSASQGAIMLAKIGEDGMISADMVAAAMRIATSEGGAFYKALENASQTAQGQISTIKDSWDTLSGKVTSGAFDKLSTDVFPKVIGWLDELNAAYDENGFEGLAGAAGGIFAELGTLAFNTGAGLLTQLYNGLTGDTKTIEEVKAYLSELFGAASDAVDNIKGAGVDFLEWVKDNGELVGSAATAIGVGLGVFALLSNPLVSVLGALAGVLLLFTTDWTTFEAKYPNIVAAFEGLTGIDFSTFASSVESAKSNVSSFLNDVLVPLFSWLNENGAAAQGILFGIGLAMTIMGAPVAGIVLMAGVVITNWKNIQEAVYKAVAAVSTFFLQTVPATWTETIAAVKKSWQEYVCDPIDKAARKAADFFGIKVPDNWSLTKALAKPWEDLLALINTVIAAYEELVGIDLPGGNDYSPKNDAPKTGVNGQKSSSTHVTPSGNTLGDAGMRFGEVANEGLLVAWSAESQDAARQYAQYYNEYRKGDESRLSAMEDCLQKISKDQNANVDDFISAFDNLAAMFVDEPVEIPVAWFEGAEESLQSGLGDMDLSTTVDATLVLDTSALDADFIGPPLPPGWSGTDHASGGLFTAATRFLGADGMHTFGESGTEALLPLDTLWRRMGMIFDQSLTANLAGLQYTVMPSLSAATPAPFDEDALSEKIAAAVREAVTGLSIDMDRHKVAHIIKTDVSREIASDVNNRRWTS
ncbi:MAG: tape measure protein [Clostridia bacterium]|nr:tape measure protein [Clostridia bacterium]